MRILLTNDDGIGAPGLAALRAAATAAGDEVIVVAPEREWSGCGHQTTTSRPLRITEVSANHFRVDGTPADCVRVGLLHVAQEIDWVLAGVNDGGNLGVDTYMSGTVAAAREAMLLGFPAIAFSQYRIRKNPANWPRTTSLVQRVLRELTSGDRPTGWFWNVNLPDLGTPEIQPVDVPVVYCELDPHPLPVAFELLEGAYHYRSNYHARQRRKGSDVETCFSGNISVTRINHA